MHILRAENKGRQESSLLGKADPKKIDPLIFVTPVLQYHRLGEYVAKTFEVGKEE